MASRSRLLWHTLVAVVIFGSIVVAPFLLLLRHQLGVVALIIGMTLLAIGCASLLGAILVRFVDPRACSRLQWRCIVGAAWVFNPVTVVCIAVRLGYFEVVCWSGLPFGAAFALLTRRVQLLAGDPRWDEDSGCGCPPRLHLILQWVFSRSVCVAVPVAVLSFQVTLYLPQASLLPDGAEIGLFVCGGCVLISAKFCAMCAAMSQQRFSQALILILLLAADWISSLHLLELVNDEAKTWLLLGILQMIGLIQMRSSLVRLRLFARHARRRQFARDLAICRSTGDELQLRQLEAGLQGNDSSDSDDEAGPGSLPDGYHNTLLGVIGVPMNRELSRRQFLCAARQAVIREGGSAVSGVSLPAFPGSTSVVDSREVDGHLRDIEQDGSSFSSLESVQSQAWSREVQYAEDYFSQLVEILGRDARDDDVIKTRANNQITFKELRGLIGDDLRNVFPITVNLKALALPIEPRSSTGGTGSRLVSPTTSAAESTTSSNDIESLPGLQLSEDDRQCAICQEDIKTGENVRPLPKCKHYFHAGCLERWAKVQREGTKCPQCRRPALSKKSTEGSLPISELHSDDSPASGTPARANAGRTSRTSNNRSDAPRRGGRSGNRRTGGGRGINSSRPERESVSAEMVAELAASLQVSQELARASLEFSNCNQQTAAGLILEHPTVLQQAQAALPATGTSLPQGIVEAIVAANPYLTGLEDELRHQLRQLCNANRIGNRAWGDLAENQRLQVFWTVLADVNRRLEAAEA